LVFLERSVDQAWKDVRLGAEKPRENVRKLYGLELWAQLKPTEHRNLQAQIGLVSNSKEPFKRPEVFSF
jgi:hypothetical protein